MMTHVCQWCGAVFKRSVSTAKFCTRGCAGAAHTGSGNPKWRGGRMVRRDQRTMAYDPARAGKHNPYILEYRLVAALMLGRALTRREIVHHLNGDTMDNRPENLEVMTQSEHARIHALESRARDPVTGRFLCEGA